MSRSDRYPITAIILTYNEADNIAACLKTLDWADDVVILDSNSSDRTVESARQARSDVRAFEHPFRDFGEQRNWALDNTSPKHEWILFVDADERITSTCAVAIQSAVAAESTTVGYYMCCRNYFLGRWIKRCTYFPSWQLRLLRQGDVRYKKMGHGQTEVTDGPLGYIKEPYDHFGFSKGVSDWIARHNRYSSEEVRHFQQLRAEPLRWSDLWSSDPLRRRRCHKRFAARAPCRPLLIFLYTYVLRLGFLDGSAGFQFCLLQATHIVVLGVKLAECSVQSVTTSEISLGSHHHAPVRDTNP